MCEVSEVLYKTMRTKILLSRGIIERNEIQILKKNLIPGITVILK